jgi:hypothetical protein
MKQRALAVALLLCSLLLSLMMVPFAAASPPADVERPDTSEGSGAAIALTKTLSTETGFCGASSIITVTAGTTVYSCLHVHNIGTITLSSHLVYDSLAMDDPLNYPYDHPPFDLAPGEGASFMGQTFSETITETTVTTATWVAYNGEPDGPESATASSTATVVVLEDKPSALQLSTLKSQPPVGVQLHSLVSGLLVVSVAGLLVWRRRFAHAPTE